MTISNSN